jgi:hypothetical protein
LVRKATSKSPVIQRWFIFALADMTRPLETKTSSNIDREDGGWRSFSAKNETVSHKAIVIAATIKAVRRTENRRIG